MAKDMPLSDQEQDTTHADLIAKIEKKNEKARQREAKADKRRNP